MGNISRPAILGISGLIGLQIWRALRRSFPEVQALGLSRHPDKIPVEDWSGQLALRPADFNQAGELSRALEAFSPDVVFHGATYYPAKNATPKEAMQEQLSHFFRQCHEIAHAKPKVVVLTSSIGTIPGLPYGKLTDERSYFQDTPTDSAYHFMKVQFERIFINAFREHPEIRAVIVNPGMVIAPHDPKPKAFNFLLRIADRKVPAIVDGPMLAVSGTDVGNGHVLAALKGRHLERYLLGSEQFQLSEFFKRAHKHLNIIKMPSRVPLWMGMAAAELSEQWASLTRKKIPGITKVALYQMKYGGNYDFSKAQKQLGYSPVPFQPELEAALNWAKDELKTSR